MLRENARGHALAIAAKAPIVTSRRSALEATDWSPEAFAAGRHAAWLWCAGGIIESKLAKAVGKVLKERGTARNWATVQKLQAMVAE